MGQNIIILKCYPWSIDELHPSNPNRSAHFYIAFAVSPAVLLVCWPALLCSHPPRPPSRGHGLRRMENFFFGVLVPSIKYVWQFVCVCLCLVRASMLFTTSFGPHLSVTIIPPLLPARNGTLCWLLSFVFLVLFFALPLLACHISLNGHKRFSACSTLPLAVSRPFRYGVTV